GGSSRDKRRCSHKRTPRKRPTPYSEMSLTRMATMQTGRASQRRKDNSPRSGLLATHSPARTTGSSSGMGGSPKPPMNRETKKPTRGQIKSRRSGTAITPSTSRLYPGVAMGHSLHYEEGTQKGEEEKAGHTGDGGTQSGGASFSCGACAARRKHRG